ncbi:MAG: hypothetical protein D8M59_15520 [Planctomycetes bacterium]|nr:hypothetical protein [Planctomycetota bacterium]NOG55560.1 hypothetical protein [Planctomycetota bacterium]
MDQILHELDAIRKRAQASLILQRLGWPITILLCLLILLALADYVLHLPDAVRLIQLIGMVIAAGIGFRWWVLPALRLRAGVVDIALRVERLMPELSGRLASAVEFSMAGLEHQSDLAARAVDEAVRRAGNQNLRTVARYQPTALSLTGACLAILLVIVLSLTVPAHATVAAKRIFLPWSNTQWPRQTSVHAVMDAPVLPRGRMLPLRASVLRGFDSDMRVYANYRFQSEADPESFSPWRRVVLTYQRENEFERLIEPTDTGITEPAAIEVWFEAGDDQTDIISIQIVPPPAVQSATLHIESPEYARPQIPVYDVQLTSETGRTMLRRNPVLAGSRAQLTIQLNKPLPCPNRESESNEPWQSVLGWQPPVEARAEFTCALESSSSNEEHQQCDQWGISWHVAEPVMMYASLVDEYGIAADDEFELYIPTRADESPAVSMVDPVVDLEVLPTAVIGLRSEARDDVIVRTHQILAGTDEPTTSGNWTVLADDDAVDVSTQQQQVLEGVADLGAMSAQPGQVYEIRSRADDSYISESGLTHEPVYSSPRYIRIITEAVFMERVLNELDRVRNQAIRTSEQQQVVRDRLNEAPPENETDVQLATRLSNERLEQAAVSRQITRQRQTLTDLQNRLEQNRLDNSSMTDLVGQAGSTLDQAAGSSDAADDALTQAIQSARTESSDDDAEIQQNLDAARQQEQDVQSALANLIEMLDQGRDSWVARNRVAQLLARQQELAQHSRETTAATRGQSVESLTADQRAELEQLAQQQEELARDSENLIEQMRQQANEARTQEQQEALAETLDRAANQAQTGNLTENMSQASSELNRNQGERAANSQQEAIDTLQSMQQELDELDRIRAEKLKRAVDDLAQAVEALVADQEAELTTLRRLSGGEAAVDPVQYTDRAAPMMTLYVNTLGVSEKASDAGSSMLEVASLLAGAADPHQANAVASLRSDPPNPQAAVSHESSALDLLNQALDRLKEAQERLQNQEDARKKAELIQAYHQLLQLQQALTAETMPLSTQYVNAGNRLDRRNQLAARRFADRESAIRATAEALVDQTEGLADAMVFNATHSRIDSTARRIVDSLSQAAVPAPVIERQRDIEQMLSAMITALGPAPPDREFETDDAGQQAGGGSGGSGSGQNEPQQLIPPIAELRLLRALQASIHESTQSFDQAESPTVDAERLAELGDAQQELAQLTENLLNKLLEQQRPPEPPAAQPSEQETTDPAMPPAEYGFPQSSFLITQEDPKQEQTQQDETAENKIDDSDNDDDTDEPPPSLDELLNLDDPEQHDDVNLPDVNEALEGEGPGSGQPNDPTQLFVQAQQAMKQSAHLLLDQQNPGLATQRLQLDALNRLDMLIALAEREQQQQQQQQQQPPQDGQQNSQTPPPSQSNPQTTQQSGAAENLGTDNRPTATDPREATGELNETRVEWGALPTRVRQMLMQGRNETPAGIYRRLTELYYMRLAEEAQSNQ